MDDMAEEILSQGHSKTALAAKLGVSRSTLLGWTHKFGTFYEAIERGMAKCQKWWEDKGRDQFKKDGFNNQVYGMIMANRFGYTTNRSETRTEAKVQHDGVLEHKGEVKVKHETDPKKLADVLGILIESGVFEQIAEEDSSTETK